MLRPVDMPAELKALSSINAFSLRTAHFDEDMDDLLDVAVFMVGAGLANRWADNGCYDLACTLQAGFAIADPADALGLLWIAGIAVLALGVAAPFALRWWRGR